MIIAATAVSSFPVSARPMTRLSRQQHANADRLCDSAAEDDVVPSDDDDDDDDDDSSINS